MEVAWDRVCVEQLDSAGISLRRAPSCDRCELALAWIDRRGAGTSFTRGAAGGEPGEGALHGAGMGRLMAVIRARRQMEKQKEGASTKRFGAPHAAGEGRSCVRGVRDGAWLHGEVTNAALRDR